MIWTTDSPGGPPAPFFLPACGRTQHPPPCAGPAPEPELAHDQAPHHEPARRRDEIDRVEERGGARLLLRPFGAAVRGAQDGFVLAERLGRHVTSLREFVEAERQRVIEWIRAHPERG